MQVPVLPWVGREVEMEIGGQMWGKTYSPESLCIFLALQVFHDLSVSRSHVIIIRIPQT